MRNPKWSTTKKECSIDAEGKLKVDKVTFEKNKKELIAPHKKEVIDLVIRSIGALSIFIPLLLLYLQRQNEINREQDKSVSELFTSVATDMQMVITARIDTKEFVTADENLLFRYSPKIRLLKDDSMTSIYSDIIAFTKNHQYLKRLQLLDDSAHRPSGYTVVHTDDPYPDRIEISTSKAALIGEVKKRQQYAYDLQSNATTYKTFLSKNGIPVSSKSSVDYITDSLSNLAFNVNNELLALEDYLTEPTGWFNKVYLDKHITDRSFDELSFSRKKLMEVLESNVEKMEYHRSLLERKMLQIL